MTRTCNCWLKNDQCKCEPDAIVLKPGSGKVHALNFKFFDGIELTKKLMKK